MSDASIDPTALVHATAMLETGVTIGARTAVWDHAHVRHGARIGHDCILGEKVYVAYDVRIGHFVKINGHASICAGVTIEDGCMVSAHVVFTNDRAPRATNADVSALLPSEPDEAALRTIVHRGATIGANATIGPGLELGTFCMVGMGAVVTRDVPPHALVVGNPARIVGLVARDGSKVWSAPAPGSLPDPGSVIDCRDGFCLTVQDDQIVPGPDGAERSTSS